MQSQVIRPTRRLSELLDAAVSAAAEKDVLSFSATAGKWVNRTIAVAGLAALLHTHVSADVTDATSLNTASKVVRRDGSGNAAFGQVQTVAGLTGGVSIGTSSLYEQTSGVLYTPDALSVDGGVVVNGAGGFVSAPLLAGDGANVTGLDAGNLALGTVPTARLGSGTANATKFLRGDSTWQAFTSGTVTSVGLGLPAEFSVSGSPVTGSGTLTGAWATQTTNKVFAAPNGSTGVPAFRALVAGDIPTIAQSQVTSLVSDLALKAPIASPTFTGTASGTFSGTFSGSGAGVTSLDMGNASAGILAVGRGGTGTGTALTSGQVVVAGASGVYGGSSGLTFSGSALATSNANLDLNLPNSGGRIYTTTDGNTYPYIYVGGANTGVACIFRRIQTAASFYFGEDSDSGGVVFRGTGALQATGTSGGGTVNAAYVANNAGNGTSNQVRFALGPHNGYGPTTGPWFGAYNVANDSGLTFGTFNGGRFEAGRVTPDGRWMLAAPASAPTDADLAAGRITFYLDESGNNLKVRVRYSGGTYKTGTLALT